MAYCTVNDLLLKMSAKKILEFVDDNKIGNINDPEIIATIEEIIKTKADSLIDLYCNEKYSVPFYPVPDIIKHLSIDISLYFIITRRYGAENELQSTEIERDYERALRTLQMIADGDITIPVVSQSKTINLDAFWFKPKRELY